MRSWDDVVNGRRPVETAVADALAEIGADVEMEDFLTVWFGADASPGCVSPRATRFGHADR